MVEFGDKVVLEKIRSYKYPSYINDQTLNHTCPNCSRQVYVGDVNIEDREIEVKDSKAFDYLAMRDVMKSDNCPFIIKCRCGVQGLIDWDRDEEQLWIWWFGSSTRFDFSLYEFQQEAYLERLKGNPDWVKML